MHIDKGKLLILDAIAQPSVTYVQPSVVQAQSLCQSLDIASQPILDKEVQLLKPDSTEGTCLDAGLPILVGQDIVDDGSYSGSNLRGSYSIRI